MEIKIHTVGKIINGNEYKNWYIFIQTFRKTGHYLLLMSNNKKFGKDENGNLIEGREGYDDWAEDIVTLQSYFNNRDWEIEWLDDKPVWLPNEID